MRSRSHAPMLATLAVYAPVRDWATAHLTHLLVFRYDPLPLVVIADALSSFIVPVVVAYGVVRLGAGVRMPRA